MYSYSWSIQDGPLSLAPGCMDLEWPAGLNPVQEWGFSLILQFPTIDSDRFPV